jgi:carbon-monoxide dehydrogenase medium subunit
MRPLLSLFLLALALPAAAQYPNQPIRMIAPFPPGGSVDIMARLIGEPLGRQLGQNIVVENRSGASGNLGMEAAMRAAPDGYTIVLNTIPLVTNQSLFKNLAWDPIKDFVHIGMVATAPHIAHPAIRNRGTLGGSLALADPAAEYPACALALNATLVLQGRRGERRVPATGFFKGLFETDIRPGEILVAAEFPKVERSVFLELTRRHGDYAIVGLAGVADASGKRLAFFSVDARPVLAPQAAKAKSLEEAMTALKKDLSPAGDLYNSSATKLHLAGVLLSRACNTLSKPH